MSYLSIYFSESELRCHHCLKTGCTDALKQALDDFRKVAGQAVTVHDAYRCEVHNLAVGGVPNSEHPKGMAADVSVGSLTLSELYALAEQIPAFNNGGIGLYDGGFIHLDVREHRARWARVKGKYVGIAELLPLQPADIEID